VTATGFRRGLEGVAAAETRLGRIDAEAGDLVVGGYPTEELAASATYEETVFLLLNDRLPTAGELDEFRADLAARREVSEPVRGILRRAATEGKPAMDALRMGLAAATLETGAGDARESTLRAVAVVSTAVATYWRYRQGKTPVPPREGLGHAANYYVVRDPRPRPRVAGPQLSELTGEGFTGWGPDFEGVLVDGHGALAVRNCQDGSHMGVSYEFSGKKFIERAGTPIRGLPRDGNICTRRHRSRGRWTRRCGRTPTRRISRTCPNSGFVTTFGGHSRSR